MQSHAWAQGGPPLVSDDPDTAPEGHWEINLAAIGSQAPGLKQLSLPDADINYGWNRNVQLKIDTPWVLSAADGHAAQSGLGATQFGVKWRFIDQKSAGFSLSTYPQLTTNLAPSSYRRGITAAGRKCGSCRSKASTEVAGVRPRWRARPLPGCARRRCLGRRTGRLLHGCAPRLECLLEIRETLAPHSAQTLLNLGGRRDLSDSLGLLFALGRDFGPAGPDHQTLLFWSSRYFKHLRR